MFKILSTATAVLAATTIHAAAGGVAPPPPPVVVVPVDDPFDGFYAGVEFGPSFGDISGINNIDFVTPAELDGPAYGVFAGYNVQNGNMVYSGEARYLHVNVDPIPVFPAIDIETVLDLRGRIGFALGSSAMVYGAFGYSMASATSLAGDIDFAGLNYGVGGEYNLNENLFVGVDFTGRDLSGSNAGFDYENDLNTLTLRAGFRF